MSQAAIMGWPARTGMLCPAVAHAVGASAIDEHSGAALDVLARRKAAVPGAGIVMAVGGWHQLRLILGALMVTAVADVISTSPAQEMASLWLRRS